VSKTHNGYAATQVDQFIASNDRKILRNSSEESVSCLRVLQQSKKTFSIGCFHHLIEPEICNASDT